MNNRMRIELVYFDGCPNAVAARENIRAAVRDLGQTGEWDEWDLMDPSTPEPFKRYGSPTVLVDGEDVTGVQAGNSAMACRADGAPSVESIAAKLS